MKMPHVPAITREELTFAVELAEAAAEHKFAQPSVASVSPKFLMGGGTHYELTETAENRAIMAIKREFGDKSQTILWRYWALGDMLRDERIAESSPQVGDSTAIHKSVLQIAAIMPLNPKGTFNAKVFFERVRRCMAELAEQDGE